MVKARDQGGASRSGGNEGDNDTHVQSLTKKKRPRGARPLLFQTPIRKPIPGRRAEAINQVLAKGLICAGISSAFPARERIGITGSIIGGLLADLLMFLTRLDGFFVAAVARTVLRLGGYDVAREAGLMTRSANIERQSRWTRDRRFGSLT